jgi:hypothetical protein
MPVSRSSKVKKSEVQELQEFRSCRMGSRLAGSVSDDEEFDLARTNIKTNKTKVVSCV